MRRKLVYFLMLLFVVSPMATYAQPRIEEGELTKFFETVVGYIFPIAALAAVIMIIYGGYMWIISGGDPGKLKQAQGTLTWGIIGLIFIGILGALLAVLLDYFGI